MKCSILDTTRTIAFFRYFPRRAHSPLGVGVSLELFRQPICLNGVARRPRTCSNMYSPEKKGCRHSRQNPDFKPGQPKKEEIGHQGSQNLKWAERSLSKIWQRTVAHGKFFADHNETPRDPKHGCDPQHPHVLRRKNWRISVAKLRRPNTRFRKGQ